MDNIHPIFDDIVNLEEKEKLLNQRSIVVWMVGLSGSGKSTLARAFESALCNDGFKTMLLDGDNLRTGVNNNLGFTEEDRIENIRRTAEVAKLFASSGLITICSLISPTRKIRKMSRGIIGDRYFEVFVDCPLEVCEKRDVKGLYMKARAGEIKNFTGIDSPFDDPENADLRIDTGTFTIERSLEILLEAILPKIRY